MLDRERPMVNLSSEIKRKWSNHLAKGNLNYNHLEAGSQIQEKQVGKYNIYYNPGRAAYMIDKTKNVVFVDFDAPHHPAEDVFCTHRDGVLERQKLDDIQLTNDSWDILSNPFPISEYHSMLLPSTNIDSQHLKPEYVEDLIEFSTLHPDFTLAINSAGAGASQNHFHSHVFHAPFPTTNLEVKHNRIDRGVKIGKPDDYPIVCVVFDSKDIKMMTEVISEHVSDLKKRKIPYNALVVDGKFYLIPRYQEGDRDVPSRGVDAVFGVIPVLTQGSFDGYDERTADSLLKLLGFEKIKIAGLDYEK